MPRFQKPVNCDTGYADGQIFVGLTANDVNTGSGAVAARSAAGKISLSLPTAATAYIASKPINSAIFRTGLLDDLQEAFGGGSTGAFSTGAFARANGLASPPATWTTPAGVSGPPPFTGVTQFTPPTSRPKGIQINSITCIYTVGSANATVNTIGIYQNLFTNGNAPTQNVILAASNLTLTAAANPYVTTVAVTSPAYLVALNQEIVIEWALTTGASTGTANLYGAILNITYNLN